MADARCKNCNGRVYKPVIGHGWRHLDTGLFVCVPRPPRAERPCLAELLLIDGTTDGINKSTHQCAGGWDEAAEIVANIALSVLQQADGPGSGGGVGGLSAEGSPKHCPVAPSPGTDAGSFACDRCGPHARCPEHFDGSPDV